MGEAMIFDAVVIKQEIPDFEFEPELAEAAQEQEEPDDFLYDDTAAAPNTPDASANVDIGVDMDQDAAPVPPTSTSTGDANADGPTASKPRSAKGTAPRQSAALQLQLKVLRKSIERLMFEKKSLKGVKENLQEVVRQLDGEIDQVQQMQKLAMWAHNFQNGNGSGEP